MVKQQPRWRKETWRDKQGNPIGDVLVKRDGGKVIGIIYSRKVREKKKRDLLYRRK